MTETKLLTLILLSLWAAFAIGDHSLAAEEQPQEKTYTIGGRRFIAQETYAFLISLGPKAEPDGEWPATFFVHATGPLDGRFITQDRDQPWEVVRAFRPLGPDIRARNVKNGYSIVFEHPSTPGKHKYLPMTDWVLARHDEVDRERIHVKLVCGRHRADQDERILRQVRRMAFCAVPEDKQKEASQAVYFNANNLFAMSWVDNVYVDVESNFMGRSFRREDRGLPEVPPTPVRIAIGIREFLEQPFPQENRILHAKDTRLIADFSVDDEKVKVRQPAKLNLSFGIDALSMAEMVRLKATNGGFQRQGPDILYRADNPGTHTLAVEAFRGFHYDGKIDFAERREIEVVVGE